MTLKVRKTSLFQFILLYVLICFQGSMGFRAYNSFFILFAIFSSLAIYFMRKKKIPQHYLLFMATLFLSLFLEIILTDSGVYLSSIASIMSRFAILLAAFYYDEKNFADRYVKIVVFLAVISLIGFTIVSINPSLLEPFLTARTELVQTYWQRYYVTYYGTFLFAFTSATARNIGIFHEPGLYQIVLNAALYLLLFKRKVLWIEEKKRYVYLIIVSAAIVSTMSTTGLISMFGLYIIYLLFCKKDVNRKIKWIVVLALLCIMIYEVFSGSESYLYKYLISKISKNGAIDLSVSTGNSRILSLMSDLSIFKKHPFGIGYVRYNDAYKKNLLDQTISDTSSCVGFTQVLAILGIVVFIVIIAYYVYLLKRNLKKSEAVAFLLFFVNTGLSQPYIWFPVIIALLLINDNRILGVNSFENNTESARIYMEKP